MVNIQIRVCGGFVADFVLHNLVVTAIYVAPGV